MKWRLINNYCCECPVTSDAVSSLGKFPSLTLEDWRELFVNSNVFLENRVWFSKFQQKIWRWKSAPNLYILFPKCLLVIKITEGSAKFSWEETIFLLFTESTCYKITLNRDGSTIFSFVSCVKEWNYKHKKNSWHKFNYGQFPESNHWFLYSENKL